MTSTGNTAQKLLINCFYMNTDQRRAEAITRLAINKAPNKATAETVRRIAKKFFIDIEPTPPTTYKKGDTIKAIAPSGHIYTHKVHKDNGDTVTVQETTQQTNTTIFYTINKTDIVNQ